MRAGRRHDLDRLAVTQYGPQRHQLPVNLGSNTGVTDIGMHGIGKVDDGCTVRQLHDFTGRRKHIDGIGKQVELDVFKKLQRITGMCLHFQQFTQPFTRTGIHLVNLFFATLVYPVCCHA